MKVHKPSPAVPEESQERTPTQDFPHQGGFRKEMHSIFSCFLSLLLLRKHFNAFTDEQVYIFPKNLSTSLSCFQPTLSNYSYTKCIHARSIPRSVMGLSDFSDWLVWTSPQSTPDRAFWPTSPITRVIVLPSSHESSCIWNHYHQVNQKITSDHLPVFFKWNSKLQVLHPFLILLFMCSFHSSFHVPQS